MSIRFLFTLLISVVALLTAALFSSFVFFEFREEQYKLIDRELLDVGDAILKKCSKDKSGRVSYDTETAEYPLDRYWIKLSGPEDRIIYQSRIGRMADLPNRPDTAAYFAESSISPDHIWIDPLDEDERLELSGDQVRFRVVTMSRYISGSELFLVVAKPIPLLAADLRDLLFEIAVWTGCAVLLVVAVSYVLAGRMLQPLKTINLLTREIRESSLHKRIPERKNHDELYTLTDSLNSMFDRLEHSFQRQKEFVSNASHELKSPLTILRLSLEDLLSTPLPDSVRKEIAAQLETTQRIQKLVHDLLDISRLEQQDAIVREQFDITALITEVLNDYADIFMARNIATSAPSEPFMFSADREKLRRMFINLIDNAVKYNYPCNGSISVSLRHRDKNLEIYLTNSGELIPQEDLPQIFDQFFRAEKSRSQQHGGTGLGLTIVKKIVDMHGGRIAADSGSEQTTITIVFPIVELS